MKVNPCPSCGSDKHEILSDPAWVGCLNPDCRLMGPNRAEPEDAVKAWNALSGPGSKIKKQERKANED